MLPTASILLICLLVCPVSWRFDDCLFPEKLMSVGKLVAVADTGTKHNRCGTSHRCSHQGRFAARQGSRAGCADDDQWETTRQFVGSRCCHWHLGVCPNGSQSLRAESEHYETNRWLLQVCERCARHGFCFSGWAGCQTLGKLRCSATGALLVKQWCLARSAWEQ